MLSFGLEMPIIPEGDPLMALHPCHQPPQTLTFPPCQAIIITRDLQTLLDLQSLDLHPITLDLGAPLDTTTLLITLPSSPFNPLPIHLTEGNILVKTPDQLTKYQTQADFLKDYVLP